MSWRKKDKEKKMRIFIMLALFSISINAGNFANYPKLWLEKCFKMAQLKANNGKEKEAFRQICFMQFAQVCKNIK